MKKRSELKIGDIIIGDGAGAGLHTKITDIDKAHGIIGMGMYACSYNYVHINHKYVNDKNEYEDIEADDPDIIFDIISPKKVSNNLDVDKLSQTPIKFDSCPFTFGE
jgi:hypothetical protein